MPGYATQPRPDDVAVVGVGCRFPGGVRTPQAFWRALRDGKDVLQRVPADRWGSGFHHADRGRPGAITSDQGGFLPDIDRFDAAFFGISPREAAEMDPQQRVLLEVTAEAMEDAGVPMQRWEGSRTSVHLGMLGSDYLLLHTKTAGAAAIGPHFATGKEFSFAAGRIAYVFGLRGPCMTVNTACSSSLTAVHLACRALRDGEVDTALAGGVNALLTPELSIFMSKVQAFSPSGRCRPFDARGDGIVRGEGCAVVVLKRYADAVRDHDQIYGVILGSAVNHDGRSAGLTVPSAVAQQDLLRAALASAGVDAGVPGFVEAHGTGTPLGDPLELSALAAVLGSGRAAGDRLLVGSLKANFGHLDATAGVAGLLKALLVVQHRVVPRQIHFDTPTPMIDWADSGLEVPKENVPLRGPGVAGVSSFGLSGTNVHVVVGAASPAEPASPSAPAGPATLLISASTAEGLRELADDYLDLLRDDADLDGTAGAAAARRTHREHRLAVVGADAAQVRGGLTDFRGGDRNSAVMTGAARLAEAPVVYAFSGHGAQWPRAGMDVYDDNPVFRDILDECDAELRAHSGWSVVDVLRDPDPARLQATATGQPALFALQLALAGLWRSWGVRPAAVVGHSMGEIAAACVAGALSLPVAARLIVERSTVLEQAKGSGAMASVDLGADAAREWLARRAPEVSVAAVNGPRSVVVSGPAEDVARAVRDWQREKVGAVALSVEYPSHGPLMRPYGRRLRQATADLAASAPAIPFLSTVDPGTSGGVPDAEYWERNLCRPVLFWPAIDRLLAERDAAFVEIGAHPVLSRPVRDALARRGRRGIVVGSLVRGESGPAMLARSRARLHVAGVAVDWARVWNGPVRAVSLPPPRWADDRHWLAGVERGTQSAPSPALAGPGPGPSGVASGTAPVAGPEAVPEAASGAASGTASQAADVRAAAHALLARVLGHPEGTRFPERRGLVELGLDSVGAAELAEGLTRVTGRPLDAADVLSHATLAALTEHLSRSATQPATATSAPERESAAVAGPRTATARTTPGPSGGASGVASGTASQAADGAWTGDDPVAVVGFACRVPGAQDSDAFWSLLSDGRDATGPVPPGRWDAERLFAEGAVATTRGGFLDAVDGFDHGFFRVSAREARSMDPQQRLFLETAWEALEHAGLTLRELRDSRTGVFVGLNSTDYQQLLLGGGAEVDLYYGTGNSFSGAAGRLSYLLGLRGPSLAVDTACSSSLTAVHLACQSLRLGESGVAVAGGANVMATPTIFRAMSAGGALSRDGRCKTFDDAADGYGRGEGAGVVVLKRLSDALRDGDRVFGLIRGSAVNQDGASGGLTVPSGAAQEEVIGDALRQAGLRAADVGYVEAHGTGTRLGDAIELRALAAALRPEGTAERSLLVGSVKTNIGHLEAAAGVIGLIKVLLAFDREVIPAHLHCEVPTRQLAWDRLPLRVTTEQVPWPRASGTRVAGVSAFGFTGTNAHVLVQEPPPAGERSTAAGTGPALLAVSARTAPALEEAVSRLRERLAATPEADRADLCWTSVARRIHHEHRIAVVGRTVRELAEALGAGPHRGHVPAGEERPVLFHHRASPPSRQWFAEVTRELPGIDATRILERTETELRTVAAPRTASGNPPRTAPGNPPRTAPGNAPGTAPGTGAESPAGIEVLARHVAAVRLWRALGVVPAAVAAPPDVGPYLAAFAAGELTVAELARAFAEGTPPRAGGVASFPDLAAAAGFELVLDLGEHGCAVSLTGEAAHPGAPTATGAGGGVGADGGAEALDVLAALHVRGARFEWGRLAPARPRVLSLPAYPWQRTRHWVEAVETPPPPAAGPRADGPPGSGSEPGPPVETALLRRIRATPAPARVEALLPPLLDLVAEVLGGADDIDPDQGFFDMGMDSVLSLRLKLATEAALGIDLPNTVLFECPTPRSFAQFIVAGLDEAPAVDDTVDDAVDELAALSDDALAARVADVLAGSSARLRSAEAPVAGVQAIFEQPHVDSGHYPISSKGSDE